jgi:hypothetical protein
VWKLAPGAVGEGVLVNTEYGVTNQGGPSCGSEVGCSVLVQECDCQL